MGSEILACTASPPPSSFQSPPLNKPLGTLSLGMLIGLQERKGFWVFQGSCIKGRNRKEALGGRWKRVSRHGTIFWNRDSQAALGQST